MNNQIVSRLQNYSLWLSLFLLPWQARFFFYADTLHGQPYEYGHLGWYLSAIVIVITWLLWLPRIHWPRNIWTITGLVLAWMGLSVNWAINPVLTIYYASLLIVAWMLWLIVRSADGRQVLWCLLWSGIIQAIIALIQFSQQFITADSWLGLAEHDPHVAGQSVIIMRGVRLLRAYGLFPHPNMLAGYLTISIIAWWLLSLRRVPDTMKHHMWWCGVSAILYLGLLVTFSRAALIGLIVAWIVLWYAAHHRGFATGRSMLQYGLALLLVMILMINATNGNLLFQRWHAVDTLERISVQERLTGWQQWERLMTIRPERWLIGTSAYNYVPALAQTWPLLPVWSYQPVHSIYALALAEWGLAGIIALTAIALWIWMRVRNRHWDMMAAATPAFALGVIGCVDHWILSSYSGLLLLAVGLALVRHRVYN